MKRSGCSTVSDESWCAVCSAASAFLSVLVGSPRNAVLLAMRNSLAIVGQPMDENPKELLGGMSTGSTKLIIFPSSTRANKFRGIATTGQTKDAAQTRKKKRTEANMFVFTLSDETKSSKNSFYNTRKMKRFSLRLVKDSFWRCGNTDES